MQEQNDSFHLYITTFHLCAHRPFGRFFLLLFTLYSG